MSTRARVAAVVMLVSAALLASCEGGSGGPSDATGAGGGITASPSVGATTGRAGAAPASASASKDLLWTSGTVLQPSPDAPPELCLGVVLQSYPPQCGGLPLVGWDWADIRTETVASGVTWVDTVYVVGTLDDGTFTLRRPPSEFPPPGAEVGDAASREDFPELCGDPLRGAAESAGAGVRADTRARDELSRSLESMEGYVASWVSDGMAFMNVVVTGDPDRAHAVARTLWSGRLCVEQRDVATHADMLAAQQALTSLQRPRQCLGSVPGTDGRLHVGVTLADPDTVAAVHRLASPWLGPDDVVITSRLRPLAG